MITLTPGAVSEVKRLLDKENKPELGLRMGVQAGGCSGFSYVLGFDAAKPDDNIQEFDGIRLFVDPKSALYLDGTEVDFHDGLQGRGFIFNNPNAKDTCNCGESFCA
jgi:iron-sulfur cluster assembly protein